MNKDVIHHCVRCMKRCICSLPALLFPLWAEPPHGVLRRLWESGAAGALCNKSEARQLLSRPSSPPRLRHKDPGLATRKPASLYMGCGVDMLPFFFDMLRKRRLEVSHLPDRWQANACVGPFLSALLHCGGHLHDNAITKITRAEGWALWLNVNKQILHAGSESKPEILQLSTLLIMFKSHLHHPYADFCAAHAANVRMQPQISKQHREQTRHRPTPVAFFGEGPLIPPADSVWAERPPAAAAADWRHRVTSSKQSKSAESPTQKADCMYNRTEKHTQRTCILK